MKIFRWNSSRKNHFKFLLSRFSVKNSSLRVLIVCVSILLRHFSPLKLKKPINSSPVWVNEICFYTLIEKCCFGGCDISLLPWLHFPPLKTSFHVILKRKKTSKGSKRRWNFVIFCVQKLFFLYFFIEKVSLQVWRIHNITSCRSI